jgi:ribosomal protein S18 acetylase RimI-like enzyme
MAVADPLGIAIRPAVASDAEAIHAALLGIAEATGGTGRVRSTVEDIRRHGFGPAPAFEALVAEADGAVVGLCLFFRSFSTWSGKPGAYVQDLHVAPALRGRGIGEALLRRLAATIRDRGWAYVRLSVDAENGSARAFYERIGMTWSRQERIFTATGAAFEALSGDGGREDVSSAAGSD